MFSGINYETKRASSHTLFGFYIEWVRCAATTNTGN
jgi:hypothetical protein